MVVGIEGYTCTRNQSAMHTPRVHRKKIFIHFSSSLVANSLNLNSAHPYSLQNLTMIAYMYIIGIQKYKSCEYSNP